jgi:hypothetical protein
MVNYFCFGHLSRLIITKRVSLQLSWSTGDLAKDYTVDSTRITPTYQLSVKNKLTRFGVSVQLPLSENIQIGLQLNILETNYFIDLSIEWISWARLTIFS